MLRRLLTRPSASSGLVATAMLGLVAYNLYFCCQVKQMEYEERQLELHRLQGEITRAEFSNGQLRAQVAHLGTDAGAEEVAREKLGLVRHGEISFVVLGDPPSAAHTAKPVAPSSPEPENGLERCLHWLFIR